MNAPKGYKRTEAGMMPVDWDAVPLGSLCKNITRGASPRPIDDPKWFDGKSSVGWVRIADVTKTDRRLLETTQQLSQAGINASRLVPRGSLIMSICATVGKPIETHLDVCIHDGFVVFEKPKVDQAFLYYTLKKLEPEWTLCGQTGSQMNLNTKLIRGVKVPVPPSLTEQSAIAGVLNDMDALLSTLDAAIAKQRDLKQAAMQQLLTGRTRLPGFEEEWETRAFGDLFLISGGLSASRDQLSQDGHCYLHYGDIHVADKTWIDVERERQAIPKLQIDLRSVPPKTLLRDGDVVFVDASEDATGTSRHMVVQNTANIPFISGLHTIVAKQRDARLARDYLCHCFQTEDIRRQFAFYAVGTKVSGVSKSNIVNITMPVPPKDEQVAIAAMLSDMDRAISSLVSRRAKAAALKQSMAQALLTGRIRLV